MRASAWNWIAVVAVTSSLSACSGAPGRLTDDGPSAAPVYGNGSSITAAGGSGWTTPPAGGSVQPAPVPITSTWSAPPAPPAPAAATVVSATPYAGTPCAPPPAPVAAPVAAPARTWSGCKLPCADGISMWHVRGVLGEAWSFGDDPIDNCLYWGADLGRTFCGCWGMDAFYRYHSGQLDRQNLGDPRKDGGSWNHVGVKLTYESQLGSSRFYWWVGAGPEYFWTKDYLTNDTGFGVFAEAGVGYLINQNLRIRAGVNAHGLDTDVTREFPADDGQSRWLWILAPVIELEIDF